MLTLDENNHTDCGAINRGTKLINHELQHMRRKIDNESTVTSYECEQALLEQEEVKTRGRNSYVEPEIEIIRYGELSDEESDVEEDDREEERKLFISEGTISKDATVKVAAAKNNIKSKGSIKSTIESLSKINIRNETEGNWKLDKEEINHAQVKEIINVEIKSKGRANKLKRSKSSIKNDGTTERYKHKEENEGTYYVENQDNKLNNYDETRKIRKTNDNKKSQKNFNDIKVASGNEIKSGMALTEEVKVKLNKSMKDENDPNEINQPRKLLATYETSVEQNGISERKIFNNYKEANEANVENQDNKSNNYYESEGIKGKSENKPLQKKFNKHKSSGKKESESDDTVARQLVRNPNESVNPMVIDISNSKEKNIEIQTGVKSESNLGITTLTTKERTGNLYIGNLLIEEDIVLPKRSESEQSFKLNIDANQLIRSKSKNNYLLVEQDDNNHREVMVASALVSNDNKNVVTRLLNPNNFDVKLRANCRIGKVTARVRLLDGSGTQERTSQVNFIKTSTSNHNDILSQIKLDHLDTETISILHELILDYVDVFITEDEKLTSANNVKHRIVTENVAPIAKKPYRVPYHQRELLKNEINKLLKSEIIRPSDSPWSSPVVLIIKDTPDGEKKVRLVIDYRKINKITRVDKYLIPNIQETIEDYFYSSSLFSVLDISQAFHQIEMEEEDKEKTAFTTMFGHYEYNKMPFGLVNSPSTFQRFMNATLSGLIGELCLVYLDDIIVYSPDDLPDHLRRLTNIFERLRSANVRLKPNKCKFLVSEVKYLGHIISKDGLKPDPDKLKALETYPIPRNVTETRSFLGLVGWYRRFIKNFSEIALPLTNLTKKENKFIITPAVLESIEKLKTAVKSDDVLIYPNFNQPFILSTDASGTGIGAILSQIRDGHEKPIAFVSRKLQKAEKNYTVTEQECLAVVFGIKQFKCYLYGKKFTVITDHRSLKWILSISNSTSRLSRWALLLAEYDFDVVHRPGVLHGNVDALSRTYMFERPTLQEFFTALKNNNVPENNNITVETTNLTPMTEEYSLIICISKDLDSNPIISNELRQIIGNPTDISIFNKNVGEVIKHQLPERNVYYVITKSAHYLKTSYEILFTAFTNILDICLENKEFKLVIPELMNNVEELDWNTVLQLLKFIFRNTSIKIKILLRKNATIPVYLISEEPPFIPVWDRELLKIEQSKDNFCKTIIQELEQSEEEDAPPYYLDTDSLLYKTETTTGRDLLVIPKTYVNKALHDFHDLPLAGHPGQTRTLSFIRNRLYWPNMKKDVINYVSSCNICNQRKTSPHFRSAPLQEFPKLLEPFERTAMDIVGPFITSDDGNKYLLTFQDHFTKYPEAIPIPNQSAETVARVFVTHIIVRHGSPRQLITDQGANFVSKLFKEVCKLLQIEKIQTTAYHPQSNGVLERSHKVFKDMISSYIKNSQRDWSTWIPYVLLAYRSHVHRSTGYTPFFLMHGRDMILPFDDVLKPKKVKYDIDTNYASEMMLRLQKALEHVSKVMSERSKDRARDFNKKAKERTFELGDLVYLYDPAHKVGISKKLTRPWSGPFRIVKVLGPVTYKIRKVGTRQEQVVHVNRLKPFISNDQIPPDLTEEENIEANNPIADSEDSADFDLPQFDIIPYCLPPLHNQIQINEDPNPVPEEVNEPRNQTPPDRYSRDAEKEPTNPPLTPEPLDEQPIRRSSRTRRPNFHPEFQYY